MGYVFILLSLAQIVSFFTGAYCFIPAIPTNDTAALANAYNTTSDSDAVLSSQWFPAGSFRTSVSYSVAGSNSSGVSKGILVHFSEANFNDTLPASTVPWIAFISCDSNSTLASFTDDVFSLAHSKGAVSAVLYTAYSTGCILDPAYRALPTAQCHPIDIFTVQSKNTARLIETLFSHLPIPGQLSSTDLVTYDAQQLNNAATDIEKSIQSGDPVSSGYLLTTLEGTVTDMPDTVWTSVFTALPTSTTASVVNSTSVSVAAKAESNRGMSLREGFGTYILLFCAFVLHAL